MTRQTKYVKGMPFESMYELDVWLRSGGWVYMGPWSGRPKHPAFMVSMQYRTVSDWVRSGHLYRARERAAVEAFEASAASL